MTDNVVDMVNHPSHYKTHSIECIEIVRNMPYCLGNAIKYLYRYENKFDAVEDLNKALVYLRWALENKDHEHVRFPFTTSIQLAVLKDESKNSYMENIMSNLYFVVFKSLYSDKHREIVAHYEEAIESCRRLLSEIEARG